MYPTHAVAAHVNKGKIFRKVIFLARTHTYILVWRFAIYVSVVALQLCKYERAQHILIDLLDTFDSCSDIVQVHLK